MNTTRWAAETAWSPRRSMAADEHHVESCWLVLPPIFGLCQFEGLLVQWWASSLLLAEDDLPATGYHGRRAWNHAIMVSVQERPHFAQTRRLSVFSAAEKPDRCGARLRRCGGPVYARSKVAASRKGGWKRPHADRWRPDSACYQQATHWSMTLIPRRRFPMSPSMTACGFKTDSAARRRALLIALRTL